MGFAAVGTLPDDGPSGRLWGLVVDVSGCGLVNVDTEELVWPRGAGDDIEDDVPLAACTDRARWELARRHRDGDCPREWTAFLWRIAVPLSRRLGFAGAWHPLPGS